MKMKTILNFARSLKNSRAPRPASYLRPLLAHGQFRIFRYFFPDTYTPSIRILVVASRILVAVSDRRYQCVEPLREPMVGWGTRVTKHHDGDEYRENRQEKKFDQANHVSSHLRERVSYCSDLLPTRSRTTNLTSLLFLPSLGATPSVHHPPSTDKRPLLCVYLELTCAQRD